MKAILVVDLPDDVFVDDCRIEFRVIENVMNMCVEDGIKRLKPMPQKKEVEVNEIKDIMQVEYSIEDIYTNKYIANIRLATDKLISLGWNSCLKEIEK